MSLTKGACVKIPDGRIGRLREYNKKDRTWKVRVKRNTSDTHQFLYFKSTQLTITNCPKGWMSIAGYNSYIKLTLGKNN